VKARCTASAILSHILRIRSQTSRVMRGRPGGTSVERNRLRYFQCRALQSWVECRSIFGQKSAQARLTWHPRPRLSRDGPEMVVGSTLIARRSSRDLESETCAQRRHPSARSRPQRVLKRATRLETLGSNVDRATRPNHFPPAAGTALFKP